MPRRRTPADSRYVHGATFDTPSTESVRFCRQVNEDDIRVVTQAVEYDLLTVRRDIKRAHSGGAVQMSELAALPCGQIENPEVLRSERSLHIDQTLAVAGEPDTLAETAKLCGPAEKTMAIPCDIADPAYDCFPPPPNLA